MLEKLKSKIMATMSLVRAMWLKGALEQQLKNVGVTWWRLVASLLNKKSIKTYTNP